MKRIRNYKVEIRKSKLEVENGSDRGIADFGLMKSESSGEKGESRN
jgi:hypothetical protein